jgi:hypothetical protein
VRFAPHDDGGDAQRRDLLAMHANLAPRDCSFHYASCGSRTRKRTDRSRECGQEALFDAFGTSGDSFFAVKVSYWVPVK